MKQEFKPIQGFETHYVISNKGIVKNIVTGYFPKRTKNANGYLAVYLCTKEKSQMKLVHRLVAEHFIPNPDNLPIVNHKNSKKTDNSIENLEWVSPRENQMHAKFHSGKKTSKYPGVCFSTRDQYYQCCINHNGKSITFGRFKDEEQAYDAVKKFHQENNIVNRYI